MTIMTKKISIIFLALVAGIFSSCEKKFLDVNEDFSKVTEVPPNLLLPTTQVHIAFAQGGDAGRITSTWMQHVTGASRQFAQYDIYNTSPVDWDNLWRFNLYGGPMNDLTQLQKLASANGYNYYNGIAKILMAHALGLTTDLWGDVPFSDAFQATNNLQPAFDTQENVYTTIQTLLSDGIGLLNSADGGGLQPGGDDLIYGGDPSLWIKAAYTLKARYHLHAVKRDASYAALAVSEISQGISDNSEDALVLFGTDATAQNPWFQFNDQRGDISYSGYMENAMLAQTVPDPRQGQFFDGSAGMGPFFGSDASPVDIVTNTEARFILAEAAFRSGDLVTAASAYNDAVKASILRITGAADAAYEAVYAAETDLTIDLTKIMTQKYFAMYTNPESWTDWRRTGIPALTPTAGTFIPRSLWYPETEVNYNNNCPANTSLQRKVWWDN